MLGGTSQYAFENIGKGGQMGVQQLANAQRLRASQDIADNKMLGMAYNAQQVNKYRNAALEQNKELRQDQLAQNLLTNRNAFIQKELGQNPMLLQMLQSLKGEKAKAEAAGDKFDPKKLAQLNFYEKQMRDLENKADRLYSNPGTAGGYKLVGIR
jgi:hypothetical protein